MSLSVALSIDTLRRLPAFLVRRDWPVEGIREVLITILPRQYPRRGATAS
jgi:hypothetical protein